MNYDKGNVIEKRGIIFKDTYTPDPKGKHPVMIAIAVLCGFLAAVPLAQINVIYGILLFVAIVAFFTIV